MLRIAVYSHDPQVIANVLDYTARYAAEKTTDCVAQAYETVDTLIADKSTIDAVFVDATDDGAFDTCLLESGFAGPVVFLGQAKHFSLQDKGLDAMAFLPCPFSYFSFATLLSRIQVRMVSSETPTVAFMTKQGASRISVADITYIESAGLHTICHLVEEDVNINGSLSDAAKKLTADRFFRLGKYLLNLEHVYKVVGKDVYVGAVCLPLPPHKKGELLDSLLAFMNRG